MQRAYDKVVCLGMNGTKLRANPRVSRWLARDLNRTPRLPLSCAAFDWALISFSVQYLLDPVTIFATSHE